MYIIYIIGKITALLRVGFGEAGAGIISSNLDIGDGNLTSVINPLIPGELSCGVYTYF